MPAPNPYNSGNDAENAASAEIRRLRQAYNALPKIAAHGETTTTRHPQVQPEWVIQVLENPYDQWLVDWGIRDQRKNVVGRVPEINRWILVVLGWHNGDWALITAYPNRGLEKKYGGRPWSMG